MSKSTGLRALILTSVTAILLSTWGVIPAVAAPQPVGAPQPVPDHLYYSVDPTHPELGATVTGEDGLLGNTLAPPSSITWQGQVYVVKTIGENAFLNSYTLRHVVLPDSIRVIEMAAFRQDSGQPGISDIVLNQGLLEIHQSVFMGTHLQSLDLPNSVTSIGWCFACQIPTLTSLHLSESLTVIPDYAFMYNPELRGVVIPESVTSIGESAFYNTPLENLVIPRNVASIGWQAFNSTEGVVAFQGAPPTLVNPVATFGSMLAFTCPHASSVVGGQWNGYQAFVVCNVDFNTGSGSTVQPERILYGGHIQVPVPPTNQGFEFTGWHTNNSFSSPFDETAAVTSNLQLYAKWNPVQASTPITKLAETGLHSENNSQIELFSVATLMCLAGLILLGRSRQKKN